MDEGTRRRTAAQVRRARAVYPPQMMYPPHMPMMPGQGPGVPMMFPHPMQFAGYSPMYGSIPYGVAPPTEVEKEAETAAAETPRTRRATSKATNIDQRRLSFVRLPCTRSFTMKKYTIRNENYNTPRAATDRLDAL